MIILDSNKILGCFNFTVFLIHQLYTAFVFLSKKKKKKKSSIYSYFGGQPVSCSSFPSGEQIKGYNPTCPHKLPKQENITVISTIHTPTWILPTVDKLADELAYIAVYVQHIH